MVLGFRVHWCLSKVFSDTYQNVYQQVLFVKVKLSIKSNKPIYIKQFSRNQSLIKVKMNLAFQMAPKRTKIRKAASRIKQQLLIWAIRSLCNKHSIRLTSYKCNHRCSRLRKYSKLKIILSFRSEMRINSSLTNPTSPWAKNKAPIMVLGYLLLKHCCSSL